MLYIFTYEHNLFSRALLYAAICKGVLLFLVFPAILAGTKSRFFTEPRGKLHAVQEISAYR